MLYYCYILYLLHQANITVYYIFLSFFFFKYLTIVKLNIKQTAYQYTSSMLTKRMHYEFYIHKTVYILRVL